MTWFIHVWVLIIYLLITNKIQLYYFNKKDSMFKMILTKNDFDQLQCQWLYLAWISYMSFNLILRFLKYINSYIK